MGSISRKIFLYLIGQIESLGHILKRLSQLCNGNLTYGELITLQILRYQYPNGHKTQLSPSLVQSLGEQFSYETFSELQAACNILLRPAVLVWQVQNRLWDKGQPAFLTLDEMQRYLVRCSRHSDTEYAVSAMPEEDGVVHRHRQLQHGGQRLRDIGNLSQEVIGAQV